MKKIILFMMLTASVFTSCSDDDSNGTNPNETITPKEYKVLIYGESDPYTVYPLTVTYYRDNENGSLQTEQVNSETNTDIIQTRNLISYDKLGVKLTVDNNGYANVHHIVITNVESDEIIFEEYIDVDTGQTFMYDISDNNYTVQ